MNRTAYESFFRVLLAAVVILPAAETVVRADPPAISTRTVGRGAPIVFLPGVGAPGSVWDDTVSRLSKDYRCDIVSIAGFAGAAPMPTPDFDAVSAAIVRHVEREKLQGAVLVGHSFGGVLAMSIASSHPTLFSRVVLVDAYPFPLGQMQRDMPADAVNRQAHAIKDAILQMPDVAFRQQQQAIAKVSVASDQDAARIVEWMLSSDRATVAAAQFAMLSADLRAKLAAIDAPVLALGAWRGREPYGITRARVVEAMTSQYATVRRHDIVVSDTARHYVMLDDPDWLAAQIVTFMRR